MCNTSGSVRIAACCLGIGLGFGGCNVDGGWGRFAAPQGPVVSIERSPANLDDTPGDVQEVDLVESVLAHRAEYQQNLRKLHAYYLSRGYATKAEWAAFELKGFKRVKQFRYMLETEVPQQSLKPTERVPEADALYDKGLDLMRRGGHGVPGFFHEGRMVEAAVALRELVEEHPSSDKIADAAFFLGEIHKEYLKGQEEIALQWYERAWTWDPNTPHPARFQAAVVCDYRLHDRDHALELYQSVIENKTGSKSNVRWAIRRIHELTRSTKTGLTREGPRGRRVSSSRRPFGP